MKRYLLISLVSVCACEASQELQGDASLTQTIDAGIDTGTSVSLDAKTTDAKARDVSTCLPQATTGAARVLIDGSENAWMHSVNDIAFTSNKVFVLSTPFAFTAAPYGGGTVEPYAMSMTIPSFSNFAIGSAGSSAGGSLTSQNVGGAELPTGGGRIFGLRGTSTSLLDRPGEIIVDGNDLVFYTKSPAQLVQAAMGGGEERVIAQYPDSTHTFVTAIALNKSYIYFTTIVSTPPKTSDAKLKRTLRGGGPIEEVTTLTDSGGAPDGILFDGDIVYVTEGGGSNIIWTHNLTTSQRGMGSLSSRNVSLRSTRVAFDGQAFYWGESNGTDSCNGKIVKRTKSSFSTNSKSGEDFVLTNLDAMGQLRERSGVIYVGTSNQPFRTPATPGQLIEWKP